ncbi:hypothetical protein B0T26DRAFT_678350 [Lasiosphaeria miniovina]|uniref:Zn(2)-C6 fungal-type domain-containing protein n=1 Tax=Lasiosphaeria miniovina TaxID=1954250 RepID=A0AA40DSQ0_9PEZI|nr:uncharacterized protein B0T26DRAFT_678350 [Lasiosphaeria miniovina]KAK0714095.1 hypothetical protein B0T26DRAFT_678350 [Lasiosphaeria miniovina]
MVFPGRFSTGCLRCRQRKVKCDEAKPTCRRCAVYGKPCTGYTDQFQFRHSRNKPALASAPAPVAVAVAITVAVNVTLPVAVPAQQECKQDHGAKSPEQSLYRKPIDNVQQWRHQEQAARIQAWSNSIVRAPEACYEDVSLFYFVRRFVSPNPADGFPGHLSFLPGLYDSHSNGLLETATLSVAQMAAYNKFGGEKFRVQSYRNYGRAIRMLQGIIGTEEQATDDKVIASILLLCTLKDISGEESGDPGEHAPGLFYLIEKRGPEQIVTSRGAELLFLGLIRLQVHSFLHENDTYVDPGAIATVWGVFDPLLRAMCMMSRTLSLRHRLLPSFVSPEFPTGQSRSARSRPQYDRAATIHGCFETLEDFHTWDAEAASYWQSTFEGRGVPTALGEAASGIAHYDPETACTVILIRSARLILLMSMIAYHSMTADLRLQGFDVGGQQPQHDDVDPAAAAAAAAATAALAHCVPILEQEVGLAIDDILASVPYALGDVGPGGAPGSVPHDGAAAIIIVQSIRLVASCAYSTADQLRKATDVLGRINASIGIRAALGVPDEALNRTRWAHEQEFLRSRMASTRQGSASSNSSSGLSSSLDTNASPVWESSRAHPEPISRAHPEPTSPPQFKFPGQA